MNRWAQLAALAALAALAIGVRLHGDPPALLWLDEAWRVRQGLEGGAYGVLLLSEHLFVKLSHFLFGLNEAAFRFWPLAGLLLAMTATARLGDLLFRTPLWLWTCLTYALAGNFVMHTREFKPYGIDLGLTMATIATVVSAAYGKGGLRWCVLASSLTAAATAVFPFVHAGTSLFLISRRRFSGGELFRAIFVPVLVFAAVYLGYLRDQSGVESTTKFWAALYVNSVDNARHAADVAWRTGASYSLLGSAALWSCTFILAPLASLWRRDGLWALLLGTFAAQLLFSALGLYPLFDRPSFYFYGLAALAVPYCADSAISLLKNKRARVVLAWCLLASGTVWLVASERAQEHWQNGRRWPLQPDARLVFEALNREYRGNQPLFLNDGIAHTFALYSPVVFPEGSPLQAHKADWQGAIRNRNLTELCFHLMLKSGHLQAGEVAWYASGHTGFAGRYYYELLRRVGKVDLLVDERAACLVRVELEKPMETMRPFCQQLWDHSFGKRAQG